MRIPRVDAATVQGLRQEVVRYCELSERLLEDSVVDIWKWWAENGRKNLPIWFKVAKSLALIMPTSVAAERGNGVLRAQFQAARRAHSLITRRHRRFSPSTTGKEVKVESTHHWITAEQIFCICRALFCGCSWTAKIS